MNTPHEPSADERAAMKQGIKDFVTLRNMFVRRDDVDDLMNEITGGSDRAAFVIIAAISAVQSAVAALMAVTGRNDADLWSLMISELHQL
jgi:hypothetical protein